MGQRFDRQDAKGLEAAIRDADGPTAAEVAEGPAAGVDPRAMDPSFALGALNADETAPTGDMGNAGPGWPPCREEIPRGGDVTHLFVETTEHASAGVTFGVPGTITEAPGRAEHPVDVVARFAASVPCEFERDSDDEIAIPVSGKWDDYKVVFSWLPDNEMLHVACGFDLKVPVARKAVVLELLALVNDQMWFGHFDSSPSHGVIVFRHVLLLAGGAGLNEPQFAKVLSSATMACERYYQAFQLVVWAGASAKVALDAAMMETHGEA